MNPSKAHRYIIVTTRVTTVTVRKHLWHWQSWNIKFTCISITTKLTPSPLPPAPPAPHLQQHYPCSAITNRDELWPQCHTINALSNISRRHPQGNQFTVVMVTSSLPQEDRVQREDTVPRVHPHVSRCMLLATPGRYAHLSGGEREGNKHEMWQVIFQTNSPPLECLWRCTSAAAIITLSKCVWSSDRRRWGRWGPCATECTEAGHVIIIHVERHFPGFVWQSSCTKTSCVSVNHRRLLIYLWPETASNLLTPHCIPFEE